MSGLFVAPQWEHLDFDERIHSIEQMLAVGFISEDEAAMMLAYEGPTRGVDFDERAKGQNLEDTPEKVEQETT